MNTTELLNRLQEINEECKKAGMTITNPIMSKVDALLSEVFDPENEIWGGGKHTLFINANSDATVNLLTPKQDGNNVPEDWVWIHDLENETREVGIISREAAEKLNLRYL